jgi:hypothetical protein
MERESPERATYGEGAPIRSRGLVSDEQLFEPIRLTLPAWAGGSSKLTNLVVSCGSYRPADKGSSVESVTQ